MPHFISKFKSQQTPEGKRVYWFAAHGGTTGTVQERPPLSVDGETIRENYNEEDIFQQLPLECSNPVVCRRVFEQWLEDCSGAFVKPPTIETCLGSFESVVDMTAFASPIAPSEEETEWTLLWTPTKVKVETPKYQIHWAPTCKIESSASTRIPDEPVLSDTNDATIEVQVPGSTRLITTTHGLQELADAALPFSDSPALRLDVEFEHQREKYRRRVREARIRAKLAKYRAERMAQRYEERYGSYPEEDEEEAQTEVEQTDDE